MRAGSAAFCGYSCLDARFGSGCLRGCGLEMIWAQSQAHLVVLDEF